MTVDSRFSILDFRFPPQSFLSASCPGSILHTNRTRSRLTTCARCHHFPQSSHWLRAIFNPRRVGNREILPKVYHRTAFGRLSARAGYYRDPVTIEMWISVYSTLVWHDCLGQGNSRAFPSCLKTNRRAASPITVPGFGITADARYLYFN